MLSNSTPSPLTRIYGLRLNVSTMATNGSSIPYNFVIEKFKIILNSAIEKLNIYNSNRT